MSWLLHRICEQCGKKFTRLVNSTEQWPTKCDRCRNDNAAAREAAS